eukprot:scaffold246_cov364-Pavlova_lutheri.AAC.11
MDHEVARDPLGLARPKSGTGVPSTPSFRVGQTGLVPLDGRMKWTRWGGKVPGHPMGSGGFQRGAWKCTAMRGRNMVDSKDGGHHFGHGPFHPSPSHPRLNIFPQTHTGAGESKGR